MKIPDQTFTFNDSHYCIVNERVFGPWPDKGTALAGMQTEQRRAKKQLRPLRRVRRTNSCK